MKIIQLMRSRGVAATAILTAVALSIAATQTPAKAATPVQHGVHRAIAHPDTAVPKKNGTYELCLANKKAYCAGLDPVEVAGLVLQAVQTAIIIWQVIRKKKRGKHEKRVTLGLEEVANGGGGDPPTDHNVCLLSDKKTVRDSGPPPCSSNSYHTIVLIPHSDGYYLESEANYNAGNHDVFTVKHPEGGAKHGGLLYAHRPEAGTWQTWKFVYRAYN